MLHIVLIEPRIPQNTGNIGRTCVALGARLHLIKPLGFEISQKEIRRSGLDYWQDLDLRVWESLEEFWASLDSENADFENLDSEKLDSKRQNCEISESKRANFENLNSENLNSQYLDSQRLSGAHYFFTTKASKFYFEANFSESEDVFLYFGREDAGIDSEILSANSSRCLKIPMLDKTRSLNLAVSVGIAAYEAVRQKFSEFRF